MGLEESTTYQYIFQRGEERGELRALHWTILQVGQHRFGELCEDQAKYLEAITDRDRLWELIDRVFDATSWEEFFA
jgi:hypothetical protein